MVEYDGSHTNSGDPHHPELVVFHRLHVVGRGSFFDDPLVRVRISRELAVRQRFLVLLVLYS